MNLKQHVKENTVIVLSLNSAVTMANAYLRDGDATMRTVNIANLSLYFELLSEFSNIFLIFSTQLK